jgi:hypothetical protein
VTAYSASQPPKQQQPTSCNVETYAAQPPARVVTQHAASAPLSSPNAHPLPPSSLTSLASQRRTAPCGYPPTWSPPAYGAVGAWHSSGYPGRWAVASRTTALSTGVCMLYCLDDAARRWLEAKQDCTYVMYMLCRCLRPASKYRA